MRRLRRLLRSPDRVWFGRLTFTVVLLAVLGYVAFGPPDRLDTADKLASVGALALAAVTMIISMSPVRAVVVNGGLADLLAADLAEVVRRQWAQDAATRLLRRPQPLTVEWSVTDYAAAPASEVFGEDSPVSQRAVRGDVTDVASVFRRVPTGRLVVIGASGTGKTVLAVLLTLDLVASRRPDDPVPVLLSVSSWDPREHLDSWAARRLAEAYPTLTDHRRYGEDALLRLVRAGRVLPVLDGLDEMSPQWRSTAITALNTIAAGRPVVLTSRRDAYADAVAASTPVDGSLVIELEPITAEAAAAYLPAGQVDGVHRWTRVVTELREHPDGPLAQALSTPLMVYLARTVYAAPTNDPAHLADPVRFPDQARIKAHLLDQYLPAVYAVPAAPPDPVSAGVSNRRYDAEQARTWLAFLAARLPDSVTGDLAWWNVPRCVAHWRLVAGITAGSVAGLSAGLTATSTTTPVFGPGWGLLSGLAAAVYLGGQGGRVQPCEHRRDPDRDRPGRHTGPDTGSGPVVVGQTPQPRRATSRSSRCRTGGQSGPPTCGPAGEHDTTAVRTHTEILPAVAEAAADLRSLGDLGYEGEADTITVAFKKPKDTTLTVLQIYRVWGPATSEWRS